MIAPKKYPSKPRLNPDSRSVHVDGMGGGLTVRQEFASMFLQGMLANDRTLISEDFGFDKKGTCKKAVEWADELVNALNE